MKRSLITFPFYNLMAPMDDTNPGGGPSVDVDDIDLDAMDRGDDFDPSLFDDDGDAGKLSAPPKGKGDEEEDKPDDADDAGKKPDTKKPDVDKGDDKKGDDKPDKKGDDKPDDKPKKPSPAEKRIKQLLEDKALLERRLQRRESDEKITGELADLEKKAAAAEKAYNDALSTDPEKAQQALNDLRSIDRKIARLEAAAEAESRIDQRFEQKEFERTLESIIEQYPELDSNNDEVDQDAIDEINELFASFVNNGTPKSQAMQRAVGYVMKPKQKDTSAPLGGEEKKADRSEEARRLAADANKRQPPSTKDIGVADTARVKTPKNVKELDDMTEEELAIARGDIIAE